MTADGDVGDGGLRGILSEPTVDLPGGFLAPGQVLGDRYQVRAQLGRGGMGEVWRAFDLKLRVEVALKALRGDLFQDERRRELLRQEVRAAREVVSPNVCRIFDLIEADGRELVSMEYVDGQTLLAVLKERGPLELKEAQDIASQFLAGLEAIHKAGLVHRDVKPENIMLTRAGRVVVMDFGLARQEAEGGGTVSGTPAYMAPEQAAGLPVDARADVYSAGVVLAEMVCPEGIRNLQSRQSVWEGIRHEPAKVPDTPWASVLKKALAKEPEQRYKSAHTLTRALEDVTLRVEGAEDLHPYPGLASFTEADAEYFFGREAEVEQMWAKLDGPARLLGLVGPSGAGKTSFLQAGLMPSASAGWRVVRCTPASSPFVALRELLADEMAGDADAMRRLVRGDDLDAVVAVAAGWRGRYGRALVIVDQFEELFTHNPPTAHARFADLLVRLALNADVHVLLSMRDDFLMRCNEHDELVPIFSELTALKPLAGAALRRALVQPAMKCGYRFEDDALVDEMLGEVEGERGALPLLAFAAARLWEKRDRETGLLTRQAYHDIGGVGGALARHAEATMERIGSERIGIVRELFRNLVTAEGTRAVRQWDELLSVFADSQRESAAEVLHQLIDARLLTSYEVREADEVPRRRVEIIHESLLSNWPRLQRWLAQDAEGALLRDQLRQAARTWDEHHRTDDMLWTGAAYREFAVWRERYPGGLTELEEAFAAAMTSLATRRRRRRRIAVAAGFAILLAVLAVVGTLWRRSVQETRRAEAAKLLALGQLRLSDHPSAALAFAIASLERADNEGARRFAVEALWQGPPVLALEDPTQPTDLRWSSDGRLLALGGMAGLALLEEGSSERRQLTSSDESPVGFTPDGRRLVSQDDTATTRTVLHIWTVPEGRLEHTLGHAEASTAVLVADRLLTFAYDEPSPEGQRSRLVRDLPLDGTAGRTLGVWETNGLTNWEIDSTASSLLSLQRDCLFQQSIDALSEPARLIGIHKGDAWVSMRPWRDRAVTGDSTGGVRIWDVAAARLERTLESPADARNIALDPNGRFLATGPVSTAPPRSLFLFDLNAPATAEPVALAGFDGTAVNSMWFSPDGSWLAIGLWGSAALWNMTGPQGYVIGRVEAPEPSLSFAPDGGLLATSVNGDDLVRWPLASAPGEAARTLWLRPGGGKAIVAVDPGGEFAVVICNDRGEVVTVPLDGSSATVHRLQSPDGTTVGAYPASLDPSGRLLALSVWGGAIRILDLATGNERVLDIHPGGHEGCYEAGSVGEGLGVPVWLRDGRLVSDGDVGLRLWDLSTGTSRQLRPCRKGNLATLFLLATPDSRKIVRLDPVFHISDASWLSVYDLASGESREVTSHGKQLVSLALDPAGAALVTGDMHGVVRVGPLSGEEPHLLYGHSVTVTSVAVSPDSRWIASGGDDGTIRLWPMPDLSKPPLHTLPHDELLAKLKSLTNLRAVPDPASDTGWKIEIGPFPGWAEVPEWNP